MRDISLSTIATFAIAEIQLTIRISLFLNYRKMSLEGYIFCNDNIEDI